MTRFTVPRRVHTSARLGAACVTALAAALFCACGGDIESRMTEVRALQDVGQFSASIDELREILTLNPNLPEANYRLGLALVQTGEGTRAVWPLQKAAETPEYEITAGVLLASTHFQTKNYDEAVRAANAVLEIEPERQVAMRIRSRANLAARRLPEALEDSRRLAELHPDDYELRVLHASVLADAGEIDEAKKEHDLLKEMGAQSDDPIQRARSCLAPAMFAKDFLEDVERARALYEDCASRNPTDSVVLNHMTGFFDSIEDPDRATQLIRAAAESAPENLSLQQTLANRLVARGDPTGAEEVLRGTVDSFGSAAAWNGLATFYRMTKQPEHALEAIEKVIEVSGGAGDAIRFMHADVLIDLGRLERAEEVAGELSHTTYAELIRGRIVLLRGDPGAALEHFDKGIRAWPNNAGARFLAGLAARDLGDTERAVSEFREAIRASNEETDAALELARLQYEMGNYQQTISLANMALKGPGGASRPEPYVLAARAWTAQGAMERAKRPIGVIEEFGHHAIATRELALLERTRGDPAAAVEIIEKSGIDVSEAESAEVLAQLVESLSELGRADEALQRSATALAEAPENTMLLEIHGVTLLRAGRAEEARQAFEKAISLNGDSAVALAGLATLRHAVGDAAGAIELFDRAYATNPSDGSHAYAAAQLVLDLGDSGDAEKRLREIVRRNPGLSGAKNDLAWMLADEGRDLNLALSLIQDAQLRNKAPEVLDTAGWVHYRRGEYVEAVKALEEASAGRPGSASTRYRLALALDKAGETLRAKELLESALDMGSFPEADAARRALARLESS